MAWVIGVRYMDGLPSLLQSWFGSQVAVLRPAQEGCKHLRCMTTMSTNPLQPDNKCWAGVSRTLPEVNQTHGTAVAVVWCLLCSGCFCLAGERML